MKFFQVVFGSMALVGLVGCAIGRAEDRVPGDDFRHQILPILKEYCYACHSGDTREGNLALDQFETTEHSTKTQEQWWSVLKNLQSGVMPPVDEPRPSREQILRISDWIKFDVLQIRADDPDPGRNVIRRLNRSEYGNSISDLMGIRFDAALLFPPDDSGHGFDNVGDALSFSPLLMEKYLRAARTVVDQAVPKVTKEIPRQVMTGRDFITDRQSGRGNSLDGKKESRVHKLFDIEQPGEYVIQLLAKLHGSFDFDPARYHVSVSLDGQMLSQNEYGWDENKALPSVHRLVLETGQHEIAFHLKPISVDKAVESDKIPNAMEETNVRFEIASVQIEGPIGTKQLVYPQNYQRFFSRDEPPSSPDERAQYAEEILSRFATRAFRGKVEDSTVDRLVAIAAKKYTQPSSTFEEGIAEAMVSVLASPRFIFRMESAPIGNLEKRYGPVDELRLATRLSYFLWSTMPDEELFQLAESGKLRAQMNSQIERMMQHERAEQLIGNFVGQWLRTRDVTQTSIDPIVVLGHQEEYEKLRESFRGRFRRRFGEETSPEDQKNRDRFRELRDIADRFNADLKRAMRRETEMLMEYIVKENRSLLDLIDCDYTFLNEKLAQHYGIEGVRGEEMRKVELGHDSPRGGVLTHASMLLVTSNPTRTSPVKRGLFILDNILGTPAPPAPDAVPDLEESAGRFKDKEPTLRELLAAHRESALCASCHARMDPLGLALENFNALGMWRDKEKNQGIDASGVLITGEKFHDIRDLKKILRERHAEDIYRCITKKLLTYALGRGVEFGDEQAVDSIVEELVRNQGKCSVLLKGVIQSAPFQKQRYAMP